MAQKIYDFTNYRHPMNHLEGMVTKNGIKKLFIVRDSAFDFLPAADFIKNLPTKEVFFLDFQPNPLFENVRNGIELFKKEGCDGILAVGGGSAIDVAKCIKLFAGVPDLSTFPAPEEAAPASVPFIAIPTTAGTGSESTRFAVVYYEGKKQSVHDTRIIPDYVILDGSLLISLPIYQKKSTFLDAFCQAIESWWSVNRTYESIEYSKKALDILCSSGQSYFGNEPGVDVCSRILLGANFAGKAINCTETTAPHAMSYKLTSMCGIPHGLSVALSLGPCFEYMNAHIDDVRVPYDNVAAVFDDISSYVFGCGRNYFSACFKRMLNEMKAEKPVLSASQVEELAASVNPVRLKNNPIVIEKEGFVKIYSEYLVKENA